MSGYRGGSDAVVQSLSEIAFILFFLAIGAALLLYGKYETTRDALLETEVQRDSLEEEVAFLQEILEEKRHGVVPCWRRPEGTNRPIQRNADEYAL